MKLSHPYTTAAVSLTWERRKFLFTFSNPCQGRQWRLSARLPSTFPFPPLFSLLLSSLFGHSQTGHVWKWEAAEQAGFANAKVILKNQNNNKKNQSHSSNFIKSFLICIFLSPGRVVLLNYVPSMEMSVSPNPIYMPILRLAEFQCSLLHLLHKLNHR